MIARAAETMTVGTAARLLRVSVWTVERLCEAGRLRPTECPDAVGGGSIGESVVSMLAQQESALRQESDSTVSERSGRFVGAKRKAN